MPGDLTASQANQFGLQSRSGTQGTGDGNGIIQSNPGTGRLYAQSGEANLIWNDLTRGLGVEGYSGTQNVTSGNPGIVMPQIKLGDDNYINVYGDPNTSFNYFRIIGFASISAYGQFYSSATSWKSMSGIDTYRLDVKIDDGIPLTGKMVIINGQNGDSLPVMSSAAPPTTGVCVSNTTSDSPYNIIASTGGASISCQPRIQIQ